MPHSKKGGCSMIFLCLLGFAIIIFGFSTLTTWYKGSNIVDDRFEWPYTAKFTNYFNGEVSDYPDINQLDYFIYAVKFHPLFPTLMAVSACFIIMLLIYKAGIFRRVINILMKINKINKINKIT
jgi:hypothetical protein